MVASRTLIVQAGVAVAGQSSEWVRVDVAGRSDASDVVVTFYLVDRQCADHAHL